MKKIFRLMMMLLVASALLLGMTACKDKNKKADLSTATTEEGDPTYNVEDDLVEGILTDEMLDQMAEEEATATEEEETTEEGKTNLKKYYIKVNRSTNVVTIYTYDDAGNYTVPVKAMRCSTGSATPVGTFKLSSKHRWQLMFGGSYAQYCSRITGHFLFHSVTYTAPQSDKLLYGLYNQLGNTVSAGCIRLTAGDAYWMYNNCASGTVVELFNGTSADDPLGKPSTAIIPESSPYKTWDPTDPAENNPWKNVGPTIEASDKTIELGSDFDPLADVSVIDVYGQSITPDVSGSVDTKKVGTYTIEYSATDSKGKSDSTSITVTVKDTTAPSIDVSKVDGIKYTGTLTDAAAKTFVTSNVSASDASGTASISVTVSTVVKSSGKITGTVTATDGSGNSASKGFTMSFDVPDETAPAIDVSQVKDKTYPGLKTDTVDTIKAYILSKVSVSDAVSTPTKDATVSVSGSTISCTVTAVDAAGNRATSTFNMFLDVTAPVITHSLNMGVTYPGVCEEEAIRAYVISNVRTSETATVTVTTVSIDTGNHKVSGTIQAVDRAGNISTKDFEMALEQTPPVITENLNNTTYTGAVTEDDVRNFVRQNISVSDSSDIHSVDIAVTIPSGANTIQCVVTVVDKAGNMANTTIKMTY